MSHSALELFRTLSDEEINRAALSRLLHQFRPDERLRLLSDFFLHASEVKESLDAAVYFAWEYVNQHNLWEADFHSLAEYQRSLDYETTIAPHIASYETLCLRVHSEFAAVQRNWGQCPEDALPEDICPPRFSAIFARSLRSLSEISDHQTAVLEMRKALEVCPDHAK